eukprot:symbB.v1.2.040015.t1/scaffold6938.1/size14429/2
MAFIVGKNLATSYYYSVQLAKSRCNCRVDFGGEGSNTKKQIPRDCSRLDNGRIYEERLLEILEKNDAAMRAKNPNSPKPAYLSKAFHALLNTYDLARGHAIEAHQDVSKNYSYIDPISSMSWGRTGVLVLSPSPKNKHAGQSRLIVQQDGDVNVMCGKFQENFFHAVPHVKTWRVLLDQFKDQLDDWEKRAMEEEILLWEQGIDQNTLFRWNNTLRWFHKHDITCTFAMVPSDRQKVTLRPCPPPPHAFLSVTSSGEAASSATSSGGAAAGSSSLSTMATSVGTLPVVKPCPAPQTAPPQTKRAYPWGVGNVEIATQTKRANAETMQPAKPAVIQIKAHDETIRRLMSSANDMIGECLAVLQMCPAALSFLPFTAQSQLENSCENWVVMMIHENSVAIMKNTLEKFEVFLESNLPNCDGVLRKEPFYSTLKHSWSAVSAMEILLTDRKLLKVAVQKLAEHGATLHETKAVKEENRLQNNHSWLRKISVSHKECQEWLDLANLDCLVKGDVVLHFGAQSKTMRVEDDDDFEVRSDDSMYIKFFDIGSAYDKSYTRRMHLRLTHPERKILPEQATALHRALRDVLVRSMIHDAMMDTSKSNMDNPDAQTLSEAYNAFTNNYEFRYEFNPTVGGFFCQQTTEFGLENEVMAIFCVDFPDGTWHVAMEGLIEEGAFQPRQLVFRTQASFWDPGSHQWQVNKSRSKDPVASDPDWDQEWAAERRDTTAIMSGGAALSVTSSGGAALSVTSSGGAALSVTSSGAAVN